MAIRGLGPHDRLTSPSRDSGDRTAPSDKPFVPAQDELQERALGSRYETGSRKTESQPPTAGRGESEWIVEVASARTPHAGIAGLGTPFCAPVRADPVKRVLEHVHLRPSAADLSAAQIASAPLDVAQEAAIRVTVVLGPVADQANAITGPNETPHRRGGLRTAALGAEVDLGRIDSDRADGFLLPAQLDAERVAVDHLDDGCPLGCLGLDGIAESAAGEKHGEHQQRSDHEAQP